MCGIIAVVRQPSTRSVPSSSDIVGALDAARSALVSGDDVLLRLGTAAAHVEGVDVLLRGAPGLLAMLGDPGLVSAVRAVGSELSATANAIESELDAGERPAAEVELTNAALIRLKDVLWAVERDRLRAASEVASLAHPGAGPRAQIALFSLHQALSALDRLEVRGRDSAGIEIIVSNHGLDLADPTITARLQARVDATFGSGAARAVSGNLVFVYKAAFEIGELGDNTAAIRAAIRADDLLADALGGPNVEATILGHTRWASVGIISEPNAHPQCSEEPDRLGAPFVSAALNGDVDNHTDLIAADGLVINPAITTDAKVIPTMVSRRLTEGHDASTAFRESVAVMEGSVAIAANVAHEPGRLFLALRGSGQALYVGIAEDAFIVASEPYGVVEETDTYLRMDGETPSDPDNPTATRGQVLVLDSVGAGTLEGVRRWSYDGTELPIGDDDLAVAQITTRDIDRGEFPHFLLKEISDAPGSFRKTLRGKLIEDAGGLTVRLAPSTVPPRVVSGLGSGAIRRVLVIGQGTAAVAGQSLALALGNLTSDTALYVEALPATELSGFRLRADMTDTLVIAISQSGTTTDTNRTVDLVRSRGAIVLAIVNRRNSDLCDKADGVLYTSDGRDVEMSVASTKAFYAQIAAGLLLAAAIADAVPGSIAQQDPDVQALLAALRDLPDRMQETLDRRDSIAEAARQFAPSRRYWALVGNGPNQIAARELRIKLSELCYKSIACDATEDKKHIDLSSEPLILVCAAGLTGGTASDVGKEVAIFRAHKAAPLVIASDGAQSFGAALAVMWVPETDQRLAFVLSAMVGHLFGYEAALAIDAQARPLRESRAAIERLVTAQAEDVKAGRAGDELLDVLRADLVPQAATFLDGLRSGAYNGHLEAGTAVRLASVYRYATGLSSLDSYQSEFGKVGTPGVVLDDLTVALTAAIEELTRPVDAIKHQAKTVTVGISRSDESLLHVPLVAAVLAAGTARDRLSYATLRSLAELDAAVEEVTGYTRYGVERAATPDATAVVIDRGGLAVGLASRTDRDPRLRGTKHLVAREQELMVARGRSDGRTVILVPETKDGETTGLTLLHVRVKDRLGASTMRSVLSGYRRRYQALRDAVTETEDVFRDDLLAEHATIDLLCEPILDLADRWRS